MAGRALPFLYPSPADATHFEIGEEAIAFLQSLTSPVAPIAIAGRARSGKSFLLNYLLRSEDASEAAHGFDVGTTVESCTRGIWLWNKPIPVELANGDRVLALVLDTEGFGATGATEEHDARIFSIATLLCSLLVYNSVGSIDEDAVSSLGFIANLTRHIQTKSTHADEKDEPNGHNPEDAPVETGADFARFFPSFLWVLRDFTLELKNADGMDIDAKTYLEDALAPSEDSGYSAVERARNRVRKTITQSFPRRDCVPLVRPAGDEETLQRLDRVPFEELRVEFRRQMEELRSKVLHDMLLPKRLHGDPVNGRMLVGLARSYVGAINHNGVPSIGNAWDDVAKAECRVALEQAQQHAEELESDLRGAVPTEEAELRTGFQDIRRRVLERFASVAVGERAAEFRDRLVEHLDERWRRLEEFNVEESRRLCEEALEAAAQAHIFPAMDAVRAFTERQGLHSHGHRARMATEDLGAAPPERSEEGAGEAGGEGGRPRSDSTSLERLPLVAAGSVREILTAFNDRYHERARGPARASTLARFWTRITPEIAEAVTAAQTAFRHAETAFLTAEVEHQKRRAARWEQDARDIRHELQQERREHEGRRAELMRVEERLSVKEEALRDLRAELQQARQDAIDAEARARAEEREERVRAEEELERVRGQLEAARATPGGRRGDGKRATGADGSALFRDLARRETSDTEERRPPLRPDQWPTGDPNAVVRRRGGGEGSSTTDRPPVKGGCCAVQ